MTLRGRLGLGVALACAPLGCMKSEAATPPFASPPAATAPTGVAGAPGLPPSASEPRTGAPAPTEPVPRCAGGQAPLPNGLCAELPMNPAAGSSGVGAAPPPRASVATRLARGSNTPADEQLKLGDRAFDADDLKSARRHYREAARLAPKDPAPRVGLVRVALLLANVPADYAASPGNPEVKRGLSELGKALELDPNYAPALIERGRLLLILGRAEEALVWLERGVAGRPLDPEAHSALGVALLATGDAERALARFERASELEPANAERLTNLGTAYMMRGRVEDAIRVYRQAVTLTPQDARAQGDLGTAYLAQHQVARALPHLERAVELAPERATFLSNLGYAYQLSGRVEEAVKTYRVALEKDPKLGSAWINLGTALAEQGKYDEAEKALQKALSIDPSDPRAKANLEELRAARKAAQPK